MIRRVTNPDDLTSLARTCGLPSEWSGLACLENANVLGWGEPLCGAFVFEPLSENAVEAHVMVSPKARGKRAVAAGREALSLLRDRGIRVVGRTPSKNRAALWYAYSIGLRYGGETHDEVFTYG